MSGPISTFNNFLTKNAFDLWFFARYGTIIGIVGKFSKFRDLEVIWGSFSNDPKIRKQGLLNKSIRIINID